MVFIAHLIQSDRHTIYIEAIFVIVLVVFKHCCVHTNQFPFHLCRLVLFQPSAAWITLMNNRTACFRHAAGIRRIPFVLKRRGQSKLLKTGFCWASTMGSMYTEGSNFGYHTHIPIGCGLSRAQEDGRRDNSSAAGGVCGCESLYCCNRGQPYEHLGDCVWDMSGETGIWT